MSVWLENGITNLVAAWFFHGLASVHTMPAWNRFCWPHLRLLTNDDTTLFQPCSTVKLAWMSHRHETLTALGVHTTTGKVLFSFHTDKHSVFIPYRFQTSSIPASCEREAYPWWFCSVFKSYIPASCERGLSWRLLLLQDTIDPRQAIQFIFCAPLSLMENMQESIVLGISIWFWPIRFTYWKGN